MTDPMTESRKQPSKRSSAWIWILIPGLIGVAALLGTLVWQARLPKPATLCVNTEPDGAMVFLNDQYIGTTPATIDRLHPGRHVVRVTRPHYQSWQQAVKVKGGLNQLSPQMVYLEGGKLSVQSDPAGATVYLDGDPRGTTPVVLTDLDPGAHAVRVVLPNYVDWESTQSVKAGLTTTVKAPLVARMEKFLVRQTELEPDALDNWSDLFHFYMVSKKYEQSSSALAHAVDTLIREPARSEAYRNRLNTEIAKLWSGEREVDLGSEEDNRKAKDAIKKGYEQVVKMHPDDVSLYGMLVEFYWQDSDIEKGNLILQKGLDQFPNNRGWYFASLPGDRQENRNAAVYRKRLETNSNDMVSRLRLVTVLEREGALDEAITEYGTLIGKLENSTVRFHMLETLGGLYERRQRMDEAVETFERALKEKTTPQYQAQVLYRIVRIKRQAEDWDATVKTWERAIAVQPDKEYACRWRLQLAVLCSEHEREPKARQLCEEILAKAEAEPTRKEAARLLESLKSP